MSAVMRRFIIALAAGVIAGAAIGCEQQGGGGKSHSSSGSSAKKEEPKKNGKSEGVGVEEKYGFTTQTVGP